LLKSELLKLSGADDEEAERALREALAAARRQAAKSRELHVATSLTRLIANQGRRDEARSMLIAAYNWFTKASTRAISKGLRRCSMN